MDQARSILRTKNKAGTGRRFKIALLAWWYERWRQRRTLETLSDEMLKDIGISREDARCEIDKPFWL